MKLATLSAIVQALEKVPVPVVQQAAIVTDLVLAAVAQEHGLDLSGERTFLSQVTAALKPWQDIKDAAAADKSKLSVGNDIPKGGAA